MDESLRDVEKDILIDSNDNTTPLTPLLPNKIYTAWSCFFPSR